jgi:hypothetical protein
MNDPKHPVSGELSIDATDVKVTDITPEQISKLTKVRDGYQEAVNCILNQKVEILELAGINEKEVARLAKASADDVRIGELHPPAEKLVELLYETQMLRRHDIGIILGEVAAQVRRRADRSPNGAEVLGPFAALLEYQYGPGAKGAATREKAKEASPEEPGSPEVPGSP